MSNFTKNDLVEEFKAKNDKTGELIIVFHYSKLSNDKKYYGEYIYGDGKVLSPKHGSSNQYIHLLSAETFTRIQST